MQRTIMWLTVVTLACAWTGAQSQSVQNGFGAYPPAPKPEPLTETVHGVTLNDPYRWMERQDRRDEMVAWIKASSKQTTETLAKLPGRAPLLKALEDASRLSAIHDNVKLVGGRLFFTDVAPGQDIPVLKVRENGHDRLFLDPMAGASADSHRVISNYAPSPDGTLIAIHIAEGGGEVGTMLFFDVATGKPTGDSLSPLWGEFQVNWIDNKTLTYTRLNSDRNQEDQLQNMTVYLHRMGTPSSTDVPVLGPKVGAGFPMAALEHPHVFTVPHSRWALARGTGARADERIGFASRASLLSGHPQWTQLASYDDKVNGFELVGDAFFYLTTSHDPNGEIRSLQLGKDTLATSHQVLASSGTVLNGLFATNSGLYVSTMAPDATSHLLFLANGQTKPVEVPMPMVGAAGDFSVSSDRSTLTFGFNGIQQNVSYYQVEQSRLVPLGLAAETAPAAATMNVVQETATSADGTKVLLTITKPKGPVKPLPTLLTAYASYGHSEEPYYDPTVMVWVTRGGVMADCHARGGGERGRAWHEAGRSANKVNAMADVIACGERLVHLGYTTPKLMGLRGASAGGLLVTPVGLKRPDLFAAIVTDRGVVNPTRLEVASNGPNQFAEMGDPNTDAGFKALAAQDSTLLLPQSRGGTDQLFTIGLNDHRVEPWMSAKLVAMMRAQWGDHHLVLIRSDQDAGHGIGSSLEQDLIEQADVFTFLLNRFGQPDFTLPTQTLLN